MVMISYAPNPNASMVNSNYYASYENNDYYSPSNNTVYAAKKLGTNYKTAKGNFKHNHSNELILPNGKSLPTEYGSSIYKDGYVTNSTLLMTKISKVDGMEPGRVPKRGSRRSSAVNVNEINRERRNTVRKSVRHSITLDSNNDVVDFRLMQAEAREKARKEKKELGVSRNIGSIEEEKGYECSQPVRSVNSKKEKASLTTASVVSSAKTLATEEIVTKVVKTSENRRVQRASQEESNNSGSLSNSSQNKGRTLESSVRSDKKVLGVRRLFRKVTGLSLSNKQ